MVLGCVPHTTPPSPIFLGVLPQLKCMTYAYQIYMDVNKTVRAQVYFLVSRASFCIFVFCFLEEKIPVRGPQRCVSFVELKCC